MRTSAKASPTNRKRLAELPPTRPERTPDSSCLRTPPDHTRRPGPAVPPARPAEPNGHPLRVRRTPAGVASAASILDTSWRTQYLVIRAMRSRYGPARLAGHCGGNRGDTDATRGIAALVMARPTFLKDEAKSACTGRTPMRSDHRCAPDAASEQPQGDPET
jgi:hypothetical protein